MLLLLLLLLALPLLTALPILLPPCSLLLSPAAAASLRTSPRPLLLLALLTLRGCAPVMLERDPFLLGFGCRSTARPLICLGGILRRARCSKSAAASAARASSLSRLQVDALPTSLYNAQAEMVTPV